MANALTLLTKKLSPLAGIKASDRVSLLNIASVRPTFRVGEALIETSAPLKNVFMITGGWACRNRLLPNGSKQVIDFLVPGDFVCLNAIFVARASRTVTAVTPVDVIAFPSVAVKILTEDNPSVGLALMWLIAQEASINSEHVVSVGRRTAYERTAHLLLELWCRLHKIGMTQGPGYIFPCNQEIIADFLGLSSIHLNRILQRLRRERVINITSNQHRTVHIIDFAAAEKAASFDASYLNLGAWPNTDFPAPSPAAWSGEDEFFSDKLPL